ncbi:peptide/nickel transport system permease protein [Sedimentibacter acidaminivorans]|uniref:Peptide/nickel transport system permease protein n=1 Tax=Sedimentibacter acidaminivorans TaxID=913099 RepID=A0ABS4GG06_9FIRM|nr:ABC transporter permease [Sedimentibacter acidaminivorans]MBP1926630.1 peptide/nickel transport system permease protein [Sedimentibacter acidaminivorans]
MRSYIIRRILMLIPVLIGISLCIFLIMQLIPGDVISGLLGIEENPELRAQYVIKFGLDQPLPKRYIDWITNVLKGDFGTSFRTDKEIFPEMMSRFKITFQLTIMAAMISWIIAIPLGIISALKRNTWVDAVVRFIALLGVSVPNFAFATLLILFLSLKFQYYPPVGYVGFFENAKVNLQIMILPAIVLGTIMSGSVMRMTRSSVLEVLRQDFIKTIRAKGASERVVIFVHALRNGLIPIITLIGMQIGGLLGGTVITEQIFSIPGLGQMVLTAINQRDYPVVQGCILFIAFIYVMVNLIVDILYTYVDPRITYK